MRAAAVLAALACVVTACTGRAPAARAHDVDAVPYIVVVVVDGLDASDVGEETPYLARAWRESAWCPGVHARGAMPARTNVNHATLVTGVYPEAHGITGNAFWDRAGEPRKLGAAADFSTETLFTLAQSRAEPLVTASAVGKGKLDVMFAATAKGQHAPSRHWSPSDAAASARDSVTGYSFDAATLDGARTTLAGAPHFLLVNLADVDRVSHASGPHAAEAGAARRATDEGLARFIAELRARPEWTRTAVVITADHGFDTVEHPCVAFGERVRGAGLDSQLVSVADGGVAHVYLRDRNAPDASAVLAKARRIALATPGIEEAWYLATNARDGGDAHTLATVHPEWRLGNERVGDLLLVAARGYTIADAGGDEARLKGNHGAPHETDVPVIVLGGMPASVGNPTECTNLTPADLGRTFLHCLGLRDVARLDGTPVIDAQRGRVLSGLCN